MTVRPDFALRVKSGLEFVRQKGHYSRMKYMGIDYGQKRTGIAMTDPEAVMAFPHCTIAMQGKDAFFAELLSLAEKERIEAFVLGLPLRRDGSDGETARQVRNMAARLKRRSPLPVYLVPETLSSWDAETRLREAGAKDKALRKKLDQAAAVAILETFLQDRGRYKALGEEEPGD